MQLAPEAYFQLDGYAHRDLFAGVAYAWKVLQRLDGYLGQRLKPGVHGEVHPGAWVEGDVYIAPGAVVEAGAYVRWAGDHRRGGRGPPRGVRAGALHHRRGLRRRGTPPS